MTGEGFTKVFGTERAELTSVVAVEIATQRVVVIVNNGGILAAATPVEQVEGSGLGYWEKVTLNISLDGLTSEGLRKALNGANNAGTFKSYDESSRTFIVNIGGGVERKFYFSAGWGLLGRTLEMMAGLIALGEGYLVIPDGSDTYTLNYVKIEVAAAGEAGYYNSKIIPRTEKVIWLGHANGRFLVLTRLDDGSYRLRRATITQIRN